MGKYTTTTRSRVLFKGNPAFPMYACSLFSDFVMVFSHSTAVHTTAIAECSSGAGKGQTAEEARDKMAKAVAYEKTPMRTMQCVHRLPYFIYTDVLF